MFEKEAEEYGKNYNSRLERKLGFQDGAETTLRKVIKYFSTRVLDENCGGYFSHLLENEEKSQELAKELENV